MRRPTPPFVFLMSLWSLAACAVDGRLQLVENPGNPLSATLRVHDEGEFTLEVSASAAGAPTLVVRSEVPSDAHELQLLGMRAGRSYDVEVRAYDTDGALAFVEQRYHRTAPLPEDFVQMRVSVPRPEAVSPGITFFGVMRWLGAPDTGYGLIVGVDEQGEVVFYHRTDHTVQGVRQLANGNLIYNSMPDRIVELTLSGEVVRTLRAADIGIDSIHHEVVELPSGNLMTLSTELVQVDGYADGSENLSLVPDVIVEVSPHGGLVSERSVFDYVDPMRMVLGFDNSFWDERYAADAPEGTKDYTHANAIVYDPRDDSVIVSLRHQDWLLKLDRQSGALKWRFGPEGDFAMVDGEFAYHQHAPELLPDGTLLVYDNGNGRPTLSEGQAPYSRVVLYELDEENMVARQLWEYRGSAPYFAPFVGDADRLDNGNVLITDGGLVSDPALAPIDPLNRKSARIREVTPAGEIVFELIAADPEPAFDVGIGWTIYRAEREQLF